MGIKKYSAESIEKALRRSNGLISVAARALGCSDNTIRNRVEKSPRLAMVISEAREALVDKAESALVASIERGEQAAIIFTLKTLGKHRGYIEKTQIEHSGGVAVGVLRVPPKLDADQWASRAAIVAENQKALTDGK